MVTGTYLKRLRTENKLTQAELARKLGLRSAQAIESIENGTTMLDSEYVPALSILFNVPRDDFLIRIDLDKRQKEAKQMPVFNEKSIADFVDNFLAPHLGKDTKRLLSIHFNAVYNKHKLPYYSVDPSMNGDIVFKVPNQYMADQGINKGDLAVISVFDFNPADENEEFVGLIRTPERIELRQVNPFDLNGTKQFVISKTQKSPMLIISENVHETILGKMTSRISQLS